MVIAFCSFAVGVVVAAVICLWLAKDSRRAEREAAAQELERQAGQYREQIAGLDARLNELSAKYETARGEVAAAQVAQARTGESLQAERKRLEEQGKSFAALQEQSRLAFENLAQKVLDERSAKLKSEGAEQLRGIVDPLLKTIGEFREKISASDLESARSQAELKEKIAQLVSQTNAVTSQANNLADAIRGDAQLTGEWGEIQLKRVLELAGFSEPESYSYQETFREDASGRKSKRTDFVIKMPGDRALVIDSKNTVGAAERYHSAASEDEKRCARAEIVASVKAHVDEIDVAEYQATVPHAFPTVLMYIPLEEVYLLAMKESVSVGGTKELLRDYARRKGVVFVNSTSVVPVVKLVEMMWNVERTEKNRQDMVAAAQELLKRTNAFVADFLAIGDAFRGVFAKYEAARNGLVDAPGVQSIAKSAAKLIKLGTKPQTRGGKGYELASPVVEALQEETGA